MNRFKSIFKNKGYGGYDYTADILGAVMFIAAIWGGACLVALYR